MANDDSETPDDSELSPGENWPPNPGPGECTAEIGDEFITYRTDDDDLSNLEISGSVMEDRDNGVILAAITTDTGRGQTTTLYDPYEIEALADAARTVADSEEMAAAREERLVERHRPPDASGFDSLLQQSDSMEELMMAMADEMGLSPSEAFDHRPMGGDGGSSIDINGDHEPDPERDED